MIHTSFEEVNVKSIIAIHGDIFKEKTGVVLLLSDFRKQTQSIVTSAPLRGGMCPFIDGLFFFSISGPSKALIW